MKDYIKEAKKFLNKAEEKFNCGKELNDEIIIRNACEKCWNATVQAINALFVKTGILPLPKSNKKRRELLIELIKKYEQAEILYERFMTNSRVLHELSFYDGEIIIGEVEKAFARTKKIIEDVEAL